MRQTMRLAKIVLFLGLLLLLTTRTVFATCNTVNKEGLEPINFSATIPTHREDGSVFKPTELKSLLLLSKNNDTGAECTLIIPYDVSMGNVIKTTVYTELYKNYTYTFKARDKDDRTSNPSVAIVKFGGVSPDDVVPNIVVDLSVERIGTTNEYTVNFSEVVTDVDGKDLTVPTKYYLFNNDKWVRDIKLEQLPVTVTLPEGVNNLETETSIFINNKEIVSPRSPVLVVDSTNVPVGNPSTVGDLAITYTGEGNDYNVTFSRETNDVNGNALPAVEKYYLIRNGEWFQTIEAEEPQPVRITLPVGQQEMDIETVVIQGDIELYSDRSPSIIVDVKAPVNVFDPILIEVPEGHDVIINFIKKVE